MRSKNPELMKRIKDCAEQYYLEHGNSPSTSKIASEMGIAKGAVYKYLVEMSDKGMLEYDGQSIMTAITQKKNLSNNRVPVIGVIPCGSPQIEEKNYSSSRKEDYGRYCG